MPAWRCTEKASGAAFECTFRITCPNTLNVCAYVFMCAHAYECACPGLTFSVIAESQECPNIGRLSIQSAPPN